MSPEPPRPSLAALRAASFASLLLAPVLVWQGARVRRRVPALPDAAGPATGEAHPDALDGHGAHRAPLALLAVGESTVAGMGAPTHAEALTGRTAAALARATGRVVRWRALGVSGATAQRAVAMVREAPAIEADVAVVALGVNDVLRFRPDMVWTLELAALVGALRARTRRELPVVLAAVPPMHLFPALPQPLRAALGAHARLLDAAAARWAAGAAGVVHAPVDALHDVATHGLFAPDGFHPGPDGYTVWGESLGRVAARALALAPGVASAA